MSTAPAGNPTAAAPQVGDAVVVSFYDATHNVHTSVAHVLAVSPSDVPGVPPSITAAYPAFPANLRALAGARFWEGYVRAASVKNVAHPDVIAGRESTAWGGSIIQPPAGYVDIPVPEGDAANPVFAREEAAAAPAGQSPAQTFAVQSGKMHDPTVLSPLTSEMPNREGLKAEAPSAAGQGVTVDPALATAQAEIAKLQAELAMANAHSGNTEGTVEPDQAQTEPEKAPEMPSEPSEPPATAETTTEPPAAAPAATEPQHDAENAPSEPAK